MPGSSYIKTRPENLVLKFHWVKTDLVATYSKLTNPLADAIGIISPSIEHASRFTKPLGAKQNQVVGKLNHLVEDAASTAQEINHLGETEGLYFVGLSRLSSLRLNSCVGVLLWTGWAL